MNAADIPPGTTARAATPLRPSGKVAIDDATYHARAEGEWFDAGQPVAVLRTDGFSLVVGHPGTTGTLRPVDDRPPAPSRVADDPPAADRSGRVEHLIVGVMAFAALGTSLGGVALLALAFLVPPTTLLRLVPILFCGGAASGIGVFLLVLLLGSVPGLLRRLPPRRGGRGE